MCSDSTMTLGHDYIRCYVHRIRQRDYIFTMQASLMTKLCISVHTSDRLLTSCRLLLCHCTPTGMLPVKSAKTSQLYFILLSFFLEKDELIWWRKTKTNHGVKKNLNIYAIVFSCSGQFSKCLGCFAAVEFSLSA